MLIQKYQHRTSSRFQQDHRIEFLPPTKGQERYVEAQNDLTPSKKKKAGPMEKKPQVSPKSLIKPGTLMGVKANSWVVTPGCPATTQEAASFNSGAMAWRHDTNIACIITIYPPWNYSKSSHLKIGRAPKGNSYSKPSIFGGQKNVSFREGI